jgi:hypothetical protein
MISTIIVADVQDFRCGMPILLIANVQDFGYGMPTFFIAKIHPIY